MMGYSISGRYGRGMWMELYATSLCIIDESGVPFVMVSTDLWGIPAGLKNTVMEELSKNDTTKMLGYSDVMLTAIHAHHALGPYNPDESFTLGSPGFAFDRATLNFATKRIVASIKQAVIDARNPSTLVHRTLHHAQVVVPNVSRNRSPQAFDRNPREEQTLNSINDTLTVLAIRQDSLNQMKITHVFCNYAVHPTATGDATEIYSSDIFGLARDSVTRSWNVQVAFFNGAEGDVAPAYRNIHHRSEAKRISGLLAGGISDAIDIAVNSSPITGKIEHRMQRISMVHQAVNLNTPDADCYCRIPEVPLRTASSALVGAGALGGASDGLTMLYNLGLREGVRKDYACDDEHGVKQAAGAYALDSVLAFGLDKRLTPILAGMIQTKPNPMTVISIHTIGPLTIIGVPGEFTTTLGRRIRAVVKQARGATMEPMLCGLADDYVSYVTTPCEYAEQAYEGASTYYGPSMGQMFVDRYRSLAQRPAVRMEDREEYCETVITGQTESFGANILQRHRSWNENVGLANLLTNTDGSPRTVKTIDWSDPLPTIAASEYDVVRITFRDDIKIIPPDGGSANDVYYPQVKIALKSQPAKLLSVETMLVVYNCTLPEALWSLYIPDVAQLKPGEYRITVKRLADGVSRNFTLKRE